MSLPPGITSNRGLNAAGLVGWVNLADVIGNLTSLIDATAAINAYIGSITGGTLILPPCALNILGSVTVPTGITLVISMGVTINGGGSIGTSGSGVLVDWRTSSGGGGGGTSITNGGGTVAVGSGGAVTITPNTGQATTLTGNLLAATDASYDLGTTFSSRFRNLSIAGTGGAGGSYYSFSDGASAHFFGYRPGGTIATPTATPSGTTLVQFGAGGYDGSAYALGAYVYGYSTEAWNGTSHGTNLTFQTTANGTTTPADRWTIAPAGPLYAATDKTYDIGSASGNRPRSLYSRYDGSIGGFTHYSGVAADDGTNFESVTLGYSSGSSAFQLLTANGGSGSIRPLRLGTSGAASLYLRTNSTDVWQIDSSGNLLASTDGTPNIGAAGANRPNNLYVKTAIINSGTYQGAFSAGQPTLVPTSAVSSSSSDSLINSTAAEQAFSQVITLPSAILNHAGAILQVTLQGYATTNGSIGALGKLHLGTAGTTADTLIYAVTNATLSALTTRVWTAEFQIVALSSGASNSLICGLVGNGANSTVNPFIAGSSVSTTTMPVTVDTTGTLKLTPTITFSGTGSNNTIWLTNIVVQQIN